MNSLPYGGVQLPATSAPPSSEQQQPQQMPQLGNMQSMQSMQSMPQYPNGHLSGVPNQMNDGINGNYHDYANKIKQILHLFRLLQPCHPISCINNSNFHTTFSISIHNTMAIYQMHRHSQHNHHSMRL